MTHVDDKQGLRAIHLFAGAGGGTLGGLLLGWHTVCAVEIDGYCREVLVARQNDGSLNPFPIWDDVRTFNGNPWRGRVDVIAGGFPCQDISPLGKRRGIRGEKSCLWREFARIVGEARPKWVFAENSSNLVRLGLDVVLQDLDALGYDAEWMCLSAAECGAPHIRDRIWILGKRRDKEGSESPEGRCHVPKQRGAKQGSSAGLRVLADSYLQRCKELRNAEPAATELHPSKYAATYQPGRIMEYCAWSREPEVDRVADGMAGQLDELRAHGNGQVPCVAASAFMELRSRFERG